MVQRFDALSAKVENNMKKLDNIESLIQIIKMKETFAEIAPSCQHQLALIEEQSNTH